MRFYREISIGVYLRTFPGCCRRIPLHLFPFIAFGTPPGGFPGTVSGTSPRVFREISPTAPTEIIPWIAFKVSLWINLRVFLGLSFRGFRDIPQVFPKSITAFLPKFLL